MAGPRAPSQFNPDRDKIFQFSDIMNLPDHGATTSAAHGFKFGASANLQVPTAAFPASYSNEAAYQAYLKRVLDVTSNQCLLKRAPMKSCSTKPFIDATYQQYVQRVLEANLNHSLIQHSTPSGRNSRKNIVCNTPDDLVTYSSTSLDSNEVPVNAHAAAHVSKNMPEISPLISAAWDEHPD